MYKNSLKPHLQTLSKEKLLDEILYLYKNFKPVKEYYDNKFTKDSGAVLEKFKLAISSEFFPVKGNPKMRLSVARKAISDFKKVSKNPQQIADLMMYYVETGVEFTNVYGDINEPFYNSMESMYQTVLKFIQKNNLLDHFRYRAEAIVENTRNVGWGFHDSLGDLFGEYYLD